MAKVIVQVRDALTWARGHVDEDDNAIKSIRRFPCLAPGLFYSVTCESRI